MPKTLIAIPIYNEVRYVDDVLNAVRRYSDNVLIVDDGSNDGTAALLKKHAGINVIAHKKNQGYGHSLIRAFDFARRRRFDWVITLDCDHQHEPSYIPHFNRELKKDDADIISGSRYLRPIPPESPPPPPERVAINRKITRILNDNLGTALTDAFCGFKAYKLDSLLKLQLYEKGYAMPLQLWIEAIRKHLKIREIPVPLIYHDPKRNFCGALEDPARRFRYYIAVIERELGYNVCRNLAGAFSS